MGGGECEIDIVVLDGGPGAAGSAAPIAHALGAPLPRLDARSIAGQVEQVRAAVGGRHVTLVGWSWGAMLAVLVAATHPELARKLVLVSSGPLDNAYASRVEATRRARLTPREFERGDFAKSDSYDPIAAGGDIAFNAAVFRDVWEEAERLRARGGFLEAVGGIGCPVSAIHGDYDPHPAEGVREPFAAAVDDFTFHLLERCGHEPWNERHARELFFELLERECRP